MVVLLVLAAACGGNGDGQYVPDTATEDERGEADVPVTPDVPTPADVVPDEAAPQDLPPTDISPEEWATLYGEECPLDERVGLIEVYGSRQGMEGKLWQYVNARFRDTVAVPEVLLEVESQGECTVLERALPECLPSCDQTTEQCNLDEECEPAPVQLDVGTLAVTGLNEPVAVEPLPNNDYAAYSFTGPLFDSGDMIEASAPGGDFGKLALQGHGVAEVVLTEEPISINAAAPALTLSWETSEGPGDMFIWVSLGNHATSPVTIQCRTGDTGSFTLPAAYVEKLLESWIAGTVTASVRRRTVDSMALKSGCVELQVFSDVTWDLKVDVE
jgi:hypothetical protein